MGNYLSCTISAPGGKHSSTIKVIFPSGKICQFQNSIQAAELMLEMPNFFLINSQSLHVGRRFSALNADEELEMANVYVMFPMKRLNSIVTTSDMGLLFLAANSSAKRVTGGRGRISPESGEDIVVDDMSREEDVGPKLKLDDIEEYSTPEYMHRMSMSRSKKPLLETIAEEPIICSR